MTIYRVRFKRTCSEDIYIAADSFVEAEEKAEDEIDGRHAEDQSVDEYWIDSIDQLNEAGIAVSSHTRNGEDPKEPPF
jgi:hypothetical protein